MRVVQIVAPSELEFTTVEPRPLRPWEVRIAVAVAAVCGSDLKVICDPSSTPMIPGHEFSGAIVEVTVEAQDRFYLGDRVTAFPMISCLTCSPCLEGMFRDCESKISLGFQLPGAFSEEIIVDSRFVIRLDSALSYEQGALVEHLCCGYRLAKEVVSHQLPPNAHIVLIGDGPIAMADLQMLLFFNYQNITLIGKHSLRLNLALKLGAKRALNFREAVSAIKNYNDPIIDVCIYSAPADETLNEVLPLIRSQGIVFPQTRIKGLDILSYLHNSSIRLGRAFAYEFGDFLIVMQLIRDERINTKLLISKRVTLSELPKSISTLHKSKNASKTIIINEYFDATIKRYRRSDL